MGVFWNGTRIQDETRHDGCPVRDTVVIDVHRSLLRPGGENLLAVHLRDRGVVSYYDHRITVMTAEQ